MQFISNNQTEKQERQELKDISTFKIINSQDKIQELQKQLVLEKQILRFKKEIDIECEEVVDY